MNLSEHFKSSEFKCKCGCGGGNPDRDLIKKLEHLREMLGNKPIIITSGYRCPKHSVAVGGYATDAHTCNIAADIMINGETVEHIAECAERVGFSGIGVMTNAVHVDVRNANNYSNGHWFGDERTGENVETFIKNGGLKSTSTISIGNKKYKITLEEI